jgi:hypothetical protein
MIPRVSPTPEHGFSRLMKTFARAPTNFPATLHTLRTPFFIPSRLAKRP